MQNLSLPDFKEEPITEELQQLLMEARTSIVLCSAIYSYTMMRCEYIFTRELPYKTGASCVHGDRNIVFLDPDFFTKINKKQRAFLIMHELDHIFFMHQARAIDGGYDHDIHNKATDYFINLRLSGKFLDKNNQVSQNEKYAKYLELPPGALYNEKFVGWSSDKIYDFLKKNDDGGASSSSGGGNGMFDDMFGDGGSNAQQIANAQTLSAAATFAEQTNSIGSNEGDIIKHIRDMAKPVVDWKDRLSAAIQSSLKIRPTYNRLSRRSSSSEDGGVVFPSYTGTKVSVFFGFDSSGSMGESDYRVVAGELQSILTQFDAWDIDIVCCDTQVHDIGRYSAEDGDNFEDIQIEARGCGGTRMGMLPREAIRRSEQEQKHYDACIVITDGDILVGELDDSFSPEMTNIVITTRTHNMEFRNASHVKYAST